MWDPDIFQRIPFKRKGHGSTLDKVCFPFNQEFESAFEAVRKCRSLSEMLMERVLLEEIAPNDRIMFGMKHLLVKYSLCSLIWKEEKVSEVVIVTPKHFRTYLHCSQNPRQKRMDGDSAKASCNALSLCCGNRESSSVFFGDYLDDGSSHCNGAALCTASGESGFV